MPKKYEQEFKDRAVRLVREQLPHYRTRTEACIAVGRQEGVARETLRKWLAQAEVDSGARQGVTSEQAAEVARLRQENKKLAEQVQILSAAATFFAGALDSRRR
jgi:transposase-like protein